MMKKQQAPKHRRKKPLHTIRKIIALPVWLLSFVASALLLIAAYAEYISPAQNALPALLGLTFPIYALCTIVLFVVLLLLFPRYAITPLIALLLSIPALWQYCPINRGNDSFDTNNDSFSVLTYNVYYFYNNKVEENDERDDFNHTLQYIINYDADVVMLQEISNLRKNKRLKITQEQVEHINKIYPHRRTKNNLILLSKYPFKNIKDTAFSETTDLSIYEVSINNRPVTFFNYHLESIGLSADEKELYVELTTQPDSIKSNINNIKAFTRKFLKAFEARAQQVEAIDSLAREIGGNIVLCGDVNDTPNSYAYHILKKERNDAFMQLGTGTGYTYWADRMWVRIDYVLYDGDFDARYMQVGDKLYSDHYPLYVEFEWNKNNL